MIEYRGSYKPFAHQRASVEALVNNPRFFLFNDIGTGKTATLVWSLDNLYRMSAIKHAIVIAPISTIHHVWVREWTMINDEIKPTVLRAERSKRLRLLREALQAERSLIIVNHDSVHTLLNEPLIKRIDLIVVDESAMYRHANTRRSRALAQLVKMSRGNIWCATGDPTPEAPTDIWFTARLVAGDRVPKYFSHFRAMTMHQVDRWTWRPKPEAPALIAKLLDGYYIRFTRDECLDLPETQHNTINVEASEMQQRLLKQLRAQAAAMLESGERVIAANEAVVVNKMLQVCAGVVRGEDQSGDHTLIAVDCEAKLRALVDIIESSAHPVIVFCPFIAPIRVIEEHLKSLKIETRVVVGDTDDRTRAAAFDAVQTGTAKVLIAHPRAMAHGLTLTNANIIVWWSPIFSNEIYTQANGRITRLGQTKRTYIVFLAVADIERYVIKRLREKRQLQGTLLEYIKQRGALD